MQTEVHCPSIVSLNSTKRVLLKVDILSTSFLSSLSTSSSLASGSDYAPVSEMLEFAPGVQRHCVSITILNDQECEDDPNEMFTVVIRGVDPRCILQPNSVSVTIDDQGQFGALSDPDCCKFTCPYVFRFAFDILDT